MAIETALSFLRIVEQGRPLPAVFAIFGPQAFLREYVLDHLRSKLVRDGAQYRAFQFGASGGFDAMLEEIRAGDLFAPRKVVACRIPRARRGQSDESDSESESRPGAKSGEATLAEAIEGKGLAGELILVYERDSVPAKIRRAVERAGIVINCSRPFDNQLAQYAQAFAQAVGLELAPDAADLLVSGYSTDLSAMANALAKAAIHRERGARLTASDLLEPGSARVPELFELAEGLARGRISLTLALLDRAIAVGRDVFEILAVEIIPVIRRMTLAAAMLERRRSTADIAAAMGLGPTSSLLARTIEGARRFGPERLRRAHQRMCDLDSGFKLGKRRGREAALSELLVELMVQ